VPGPLTPPQHALDELLTSELPLPGAARTLRLIGLSVAGLLGAAMVVVRVADGPAAFLEGVVARGASSQLLLASIPLAWGLSRSGPAPVSEGVMALAELRGFTRSEVDRRALLVALRRAIVLVLPPVAALALEACLLSLPDLAELGHRVLTGGAQVLLVLLASVGLAALGGTVARLAPRHGKTALLAVLLLPWAISFLPGIPRELSLIGLYQFAVRGLLGS
jgi:hypothetical protein